MALLSDWIYEIIIFLLIATIIDLLVPKNSYKKYVKLVVGLVLLLIFLKPVFYLFNIDVEQEVENFFYSINQETEESKNKKYNLKEKENEIQSGQDAYIYEHMAEELIAIAEYPIIDEYQLEIIDIDFVFNSEIKTYENLEQLIVYVSEYEGEGRVVKDVKEIVINSDEPEGNNEDIQDQFIQLLRELWELENQEIRIIWEGS